MTDPLNFSGKCFAQHCTLVGTLSDSTNGADGRFLCTYHYGRPANEWGRVNNVLQNSKILLDLIARCLNPDRYYRGDNFITPRKQALDDVLAIMDRENLLEFWSEQGIEAIARNLHNQIHQRISQNRTPLASPVAHLVDKPARVTIPKMQKGYDYKRLQSGDEE